MSVLHTLDGVHHATYHRLQDDTDPAERQWKRERAGGNYGAGTKEVQQRNYVMVSE
jgi:hypothetical protein